MRHHGPRRVDRGQADLRPVAQFATSQLTGSYVKSDAGSHFVKKDIVA